MLGERRLRCAQVLGLEACHAARYPRGVRERTSRETPPLSHVRCRGRATREGARVPAKEAARGRGGVDAKVVVFAARGCSRKPANGTRQRNRHGAAQPARVEAVDAQERRHDLAAEYVANAREKESGRRDAGVRRVYARAHALMPRSKRAPEDSRQDVAIPRLCRVV